MGQQEVYQVMKGKKEITVDEIMNESGCGYYSVVRALNQMKKYNEVSKKETSKKGINGRKICVWMLK